MPQVVFPFAFQVHEVHLPPLFGQSPHGFAARYQPDSLEARTILREEAATVLQCLTGECASSEHEERHEKRHVLGKPCHAHICSPCLAGRATLELRQALAASFQPAGAFIEVPPFLSELHGSFADLARQLQECVHKRRRRRGEGQGEVGVQSGSAVWCCDVGVLRLP